MEQKHQDESHGDGLYRLEWKIPKRKDPWRRTEKSCWLEQLTKLPNEDGDRLVFGKEPSLNRWWIRKKQYRIRDVNFSLRQYGREYDKRNNEINPQSTIKWG